MSLRVHGGPCEEVVDPTWMVRLREREPRAIEWAIERFGESTRRLLTRLGVAHEELDDTLQEVFVKVWLHADRFRGESRLGTWIAAIAIRQARAVCRKRRTWRHWCQAWLGARGDWRPETRTHGDERIARMERGMARLRAADREILVLFHLEQRGVDEIAGLLGIRAAAVHARAHRARERLKQLIDDPPETRSSRSNR